MKKLRPWLFAAISGFLAICAISVALEATEDVWANWTVAGALALLTVWLIRRALIKRPSPSGSDASTRIPPDTPVAPVVPGKAAEDHPLPESDGKPKYAYENFRISGVTYNNDDGMSRQELLRRIKFSEPPFENGDSLDVSLKPSTFNGSPCIECRVNGILIGHVPKDKVESVAQAIEKEGACVSGFRITGGGEIHGKAINYGVEMAVRYEL